MEVMIAEAPARCSSMLGRSAAAPSDVRAMGRAGGAGLRAPCLPSRRSRGGAGCELAASAPRERRNPVQSSIRSVLDVEPRVFADGEPHSCVDSTESLLQKLADMGPPNDSALSRMNEAADRLFLWDDVPKLGTRSGHHPTFHCNSTAIPLQFRCFVEVVGGPAAGRRGERAQPLAWNSGADSEWETVHTPLHVSTCWLTEWVLRCTPHAQRWRVCCPSSTVGSRRLARTGGHTNS